MKEIVVDGEAISVTEDMIFRGTFSCITCEARSDEVVNLAGTLYWICPNGHNSKVVLYE